MSARKQSGSPGGIRLSVRYEGRVQGVGFRFAVVEASQDYDVTGFVRNEMDGSVRVVAEGDEGDVRAFLHAIESSRVGQYITAHHASTSEPTGEFGAFAIQY